MNEPGDGRSDDRRRQVGATAPCTRPMRRWPLHPCPRLMIQDAWLPQYVRHALQPSTRKHSVGLPCACHLVPCQLQTTCSCQPASTRAFPPPECTCPTFPSAVSFKLFMKRTMILKNAFLRRAACACRHLGALPLVARFQCLFWHSSEQNSTCLQPAHLRSCNARFPQLLQVRSTCL